MLNKAINKIKTNHKFFVRIIATTPKYYSKQSTSDGVHMALLALVTQGALTDDDFNILWPYYKQALKAVMRHDRKVNPKRKPSKAAWRKV